MTNNIHLNARVVAGYGRNFLIENIHGDRFLAYPRGKKSNCVVGDFIEYTNTEDSHSAEAVINTILPRTNLLLRQDQMRTKYFASNVDQVIFLVSCFPALNESQLSRALIACEQAHIPSQIFFNKIDLPGYTETKAQLTPYYQMGIPITEISIKTDSSRARERIQPILNNKISLVIGPSGSGKSSLLNLMVPHAHASVAEVSHALQSGRHTTTSTTLYWLDSQRQSGLVDSPGFQEFGLQQIQPAELAGLMLDIRSFLGGCRFYNCTHRHEPHCSVNQAYQDGKISQNRLDIYRSIYDEISTQKW